MHRLPGHGRRRFQRPDLEPHHRDPTLHAHRTPRLGQSRLADSPRRHSLPCQRRPPSHHPPLAPPPPPPTPPPTAAYDVTVRSATPDTGTHRRPQPRHNAPVGAACPLTLDGPTPLLATASYDHSIRIWTPATGRKLRTITGHNAGVSAICA